MGAGTATGKCLQTSTAQQLQAVRPPLQGWHIFTTTKHKYLYLSRAFHPGNGDDTAAARGFSLLWESAVQKAKGITHVITRVLRLPMIGHNSSRVWGKGGKGTRSIRKLVEVRNGYPKMLPACSVHFQITAPWHSWRSQLVCSCTADIPSSSRRAHHPLPPSSRCLPQACPAHVQWRTAFLTTQALQTAEQATNWNGVRLKARSVPHCVGTSRGEPL